MKLLIMQSSLISCHFIPLGSEYPPQHPVLKHPQWRNSKEDVKNERKRKRKEAEKRIKINNGEKEEREGKE
jgi:hypothetical protein